MEGFHTIFIVTGNRHKAEEARAVFSEFGIGVEQIADEKLESKEMDLKETAEYNAKKFFEKYRKPVIVDDTGVFFRAYKDFPGSHPKMIFDMLGYKGLLKLLEGEDRRAYFKTVVGYCDGSEAVSFDGTWQCTVDEKVHDLDKDVLPYERILLYEGKPISRMSREEKNSVSHRAAAFRKAAHFILDKRRDKPEQSA
jgi:XTP/dITP diphosphohydrolase